jgi:hypothetical protein
MKKIGNQKLKYFIYHMRWQFSWVVMIPIMTLLENIIPLWMNLSVGSFFGACVFWYIDKKIFKENK